MKNKKVVSRLRRKKGIRKNIYGTAEKPRLSVFRSAKHIYIQAIDDEAGETIATLSTLNKEVKKDVPKAEAEEAKKKLETAGATVDLT